MNKNKKAFFIAVAKLCDKHKVCISGAKTVFMWSVKIDGQEYWLENSESYDSVMTGMFPPATEFNMFAKTSKRK